MQLSDLRYFRAIASAGSFVRGARAVHVSPPAASKAVQRLEDEIGRPLFVRTTRRVTLTDAGRILLERSRRIFRELEELGEELAGAEPRGELRIAAMEVFSIQLLPRALVDLCRAHPAIEPRVHEMIPERMTSLIAEGRIDVGFTVGTHATSAVECRSLGHSRGVLVCGRGHPLFAKRRVRAKELDAYPFVLPRFLDSEHLPPLDQFPGDVPRRVGATIELLQMEVALVESGAFLGFLPEITVAENLRAGRLRALSGLGLDVEFQLSALTPRGMKKASVERLLERVEHHLRSRRAPAA